VNNINDPSVTRIILTQRDCVFGEVF
jgi:hypothetical protein